VLGEDVVDGVAVTRYRLRLSAADLLQLRGSPQAATLAGVQGQLDIWLDGDDLPRRLRARFVGPDNRGLLLDTRYSRYGSSSSVRAPVRGVLPTPGGSAQRTDPVTSIALTTFASA
jgi:hypothetical protein